VHKIFVHTIFPFTAQNNKLASRHGRLDQAKTDADDGAVSAH
jgi:hypothetical protein